MSRTPSLGDGSGFWGPPKVRKWHSPGSSRETSKKLDGVWLRTGAWEADLPGVYPWVPKLSAPPTQPQFPPMCVMWDCHEDAMR